MSVPAIESLAPATAQALTPAASTSSATVGALTNKDFLTLLVASLKYQDPSEPMKTQELMQQTTAMSTVEQLLEVARLSQESFALQQRGSAISLVGRQVTYTEGDAELSGVVTAVDITTSTPILRIGNDEVAMADITGVTDLNTASRSTTSGSSPSAA